MDIALAKTWLKVWAKQNVEITIFD